jgi:hypothetical protein
MGMIPVALKMIMRNETKIMKNESESLTRIEKLGKMNKIKNKYDNLWQDTYSSLMKNSEDKIIEQLHHTGYYSSWRFWFLSI